MLFNLHSVISVLDKEYKLSADAEESAFKDCNGNYGAIAVREGKLFKMKFLPEPAIGLVNIS